MKLKAFYVSCLILFFAPLVSFAAEAEPVQAKLVAEEMSIQPGRPFWVGVELDMASGWDTYWVNPGDSGFPTKVTWQLPEGFEAGPLMWPYPQKFDTQSQVGFGYTDSVLLLAQLTPPETLASDTEITIGADVSWVACNEECVPGTARLNFSLPVQEKLPEKNTEVSATFSKTRELLPQSLGNDRGELTVAAQAEEIILNFAPVPGTFGEIEELLFIPEESEVVDLGAPQTLQIESNGFTLNVKKAHPGSQNPSHVKGVLLVSEKGRQIKRAIQIDSQITAFSSAAAATTAATTSAFMMTLGLAFLGGLILNVMPCVLPVIALKIMSFVKMAHEKRSLVLKHGVLFTLGVLVSFWILSGALLVLRAYGEQIGWGFQLQEPLFVAILASILFLMGLSLFGVFEMGSSLISLGQKSEKASSSPLIASFLSGVLATLVATPCTGPLLGPALGFAMTLPSAQALSIFTSMGLGMAAPYLLFSAFPRLVRFLPKPGNWMIIFKHLMGFVMMITVAWLVWVFGAQTDNMAVFILLASLIIIAIGAWIFGRWATPVKRRTTRTIAMVATLLLFALGIGSVVKTTNLAKAHDFALPVAVNDEGWLAYSPEKVQEMRQSGSPVFVDFTAKWCLICQTNKMTLHSSEVEQFFEEKGVTKMVADWTKKDALITQELQRLGRSGVPVYVLYPSDPNAPPQILPQTLSTTVLRDYLGNLDTSSQTVNVD
ncbi:MAG: Thiol:disulfide interchange protein DsbD [Chlamydiae bacterium]|nr:Thiol:disulfide interchange protein DsbD [Chlamydiota bacterium]